MKNASTPSVLFRLCDDALIVANTGAPFTREGVISICYTFLSAKTSLSAKPSHPIDCFVECKDCDLPNKIREHMMEKWNANDRQSRINAEKETAKDYSGRFALELLQNADDAVGKESSEMIGMKGLGFKSVFEIADEPEIHSGDFHFRLKKEPDGLRIPECIKVVECAATTQIRLPFRNDAAKKAALDALESMRADILFFCQSLQRIDIEIDGLPARRLEIHPVPRNGENLGQIRVDDIELVEIVEKAAKKQ